MLQDGRFQRSGMGLDSASGGGGILAHLEGAYNLARWMMGNEHDAQDVVQEAFVKAMRAGGEARQTGSQRAWFLRIVRNGCLDALRRLKRSPIEEREEEVAGVFEGEVGAILQRREDVARVRAALEGLPALVRETVVLREMEGMSYKEIAAVTGVAMGTVMSRLSRGRMQLAMILGKEDAE